MLTDDYITSINDSRIFTIVLASISALFPLSVVFILIQRYNTLVRGKSLIHYILMIAIADTMTAIFYAFGYPSSGSLACSIQGFFRMYFARMSWFYTDVLILQLFYVVVYKSYFLDKRYMHAIVFTLNIVLSLIPFSTGTSYGQDDDDQGIPLGLCAMSMGKGNVEELTRWLNYTFNVQLYISFIFIIFLSVVIVVYSLTVKNTKSSNIYMNERMKDSWKIIILYPIAMMIAWVPCEAYAFYFNLYFNKSGEAPPNGLIINDYLQAINVLYGPLLSLIFYTKTIDARRAWIHNLRCILYLVMNADIDDRESCSSIISIEDVRITEYSSSKVSRSISRLTNLTSSLWSRKPSSLTTPIINSEHQVNPISKDTIVRIEENL